MSSGLGITLYLFFCPIREYILLFMYINVCVCLCEKCRAKERLREGVRGFLDCVRVCACVRAHVGVCGSCCNGRHHADFISVISACQPGALGTGVELFYILLSALNVFNSLNQYSETTQFCRVYSPQQTNLTIHPSS